MANAQQTTTRPRPLWLIAGTTAWLLLASEISSEENAPALAQILGVAAWSVLAGAGARYLLLVLSKAAARLALRAARVIGSRRRR